MFGLESVHISQYLVNYSRYGIFMICKKVFVYSSLASHYPLNGHFMNT